MRIDGASVLITGGANGLGLAIATHLASLGAAVAAGDRDAAALARLPAGIAGLALDAANPDEAKRAVFETVSLHGRLDVLINNAGVIHSEPFVNVAKTAGIMHSYDNFRATLAANLDTVFVMTSAAVERMVMSRAGGVVVNISSIAASGNEGQTAYAAAKAAVNAMTVTWSKELGRWGIRCNAVAPGFIATESTRRALSEGMLKHVRSSTPLRRLGEPSDVARAVAAAIENDFMTGAVLAVDGGLTL